MLAITVIICTRKPREDHLNRVLAALRAQTLPMDQWELLVLSVAADGPLEGKFDISWHRNARFILDENHDKTHRMLRGIFEARGNFLVIVDDDNVLRSDYLSNALNIGAKYPWLGAWGGSCVPEFEVEPPAELRPHLVGLVIEKRTVAVWSKIPRGNWALPPGAGMVVRKALAFYYRNQVINDPLRNSLGPGNNPPRGGEDTDLALCAFQIGLGTGMFPELELTHLVPARKLNLKSLENLYECLGYAGALMEGIHDPEKRYESRHPIPGQIPPTRFKYFSMKVLMWAMRKSRAERRIALATERGRLRALHDLRRAGRLTGLKEILGPVGSL